VAARTRNSPLRLAAAAHAQEDAAAEGVLLATSKAVKLLSAEELARKRACLRGFSLPLRCNGSVSNKRHSAAGHLPLGA